MDEKDYQEFSNLLENILINYDQLNDKMKINDFLENEVEKADIQKDNEKVKLTVKEVSDTVELIVSKFKSLQEAKKNGNSREDWLEKDILSALSNFNDEEKADIIKQTNESLKKNNADFIDALNQNHKDVEGE